MLTFKKLSEINLQRCLRWHPNGLEEWTVSDWFTATVGELGEAGNLIKKLNRIRDNLVGNQGDFKQTDVVVTKIGEEIADTVIYLDLLAQRLNIDLEEVVRMKFNEVSKRNNFPERL